jgi:hypothetical protein
MVAAVLACWSGGAFGQSGPQLSMQEVFPLPRPPLVAADKKIVIPNAELGGGLIKSHIIGFRHIKLDGNEVEVRGHCRSACTTVMVFIGKEKLCFAEGSSLQFHAGRLAPPDWKLGDQWAHLPPAYAAVKWLQENYPADIRDWIDARGGYLKLPTDTSYWVLTAPELWKMGYRKCAD